MKLVFSNGAGSVICLAGYWEIAALPALPFACDGIFYDEFSDTYLRHVGGGTIHMTDDEKAAVAEYLATAVQPPSPPPTPQQIEAAVVAAVQDYLDAAARGLGYDGIVSACSYAGAPNAFQAESAAVLSWRAACWSHCYQVLGTVLSGSRAAPTPSELVAELPLLVLP